MDQQIGNIHGFAVAHKGSAQTPEVQSLTIDATGGTFDLVVLGEAVDTQAYNIAAATLQTNINTALSGTDDSVTVTGGPGDSGGTTPYVITFDGTGDYAEITADDTNLTGGGSSATVATTTPGDTTSPVFKSNTNLSGTDLANTGFSDADLLSIAAMRSRLATIDAGLYTAAYLNGMTYNDMVYAIRLNDHPQTIKQ